MKSVEFKNRMDFKQWIAQVVSWKIFGIFQDRKVSSLSKERKKCNSQKFRREGIKIQTEAKAWPEYEVDLRVSWFWSISKKRKSIWIALLSTMGWVGHMFYWSEMYIILSLLASAANDSYIIKILYILFIGFQLLK